ncbi:IS3 family transposase, partial [Shouchella clausii]|uniref:IS3 family transposase n=1 Tax=Shouchella clausii TaxID=79880 RepID=UPI000BCD9D1A
MSLNETQTNTRYQQCAASCKSPVAYYYKAKERQSEDDVTGAVIEIFEQNRSAYGTRKIKVELHKRGEVCDD